MMNDEIRWKYDLGSFKWNLNNTTICTCHHYTWWKDSQVIRNCTTRHLIQHWEPDMDQIFDYSKSSIYFWSRRQQPQCSLVWEKGTYHTHHGNFAQAYCYRIQYKVALTEALDV